MAATATQHGAEGLTAGGLAAFLLSFVPEGTLTDDQSFHAVWILAAIIGYVFKLLRDRGILPELSKISLVLLVCLALGCSATLGHVDPELIRTEDGREVVTCEFKGVAVAIGNASTCTDTNRGGEASSGLINVASAGIQLVLGLVSGFFGGLSSVTAPAPASTSK